MISIIFDELKHFTLKSGFLAFLEKARLKSFFFQHSNTQLMASLGGQGSRVRS